MFDRSRRRLAQWFTLSMGSILILFAVLLYLREARDRLQNFDSTLYATSQTMMGGLEELEYQGQRQVDLEDVPLLGQDSRLLETRLIFARWYSSQRQVQQFFGPFPPEQLRAPMGFVTLSDPDSSDRLRQLTLPVYRGDVLLGYVQIAASLSSVQVPLQNLQIFLTLGVPVALGTIALTGWWLGGRAMAPIRQSYQQLQQFTAAASHELRAPLAGIISNAQVGLMDPIDPQEQSTRLSTIAAVAEEMSHLVSQLLFLARQPGTLPANVLQTVDGQQFLQQVMDTLAPQVMAKPLTLQTSFPASPVDLTVESDLMRQAIANLLSNACRYTPAGGTITVSLKPSHRWIVIAVADTGIGIAAADLPHIFDHFYRCDGVRSRQTGGFGLGLAIARQIVEAHQGTLTVTSAPEVGSTFEIRLPRTTDIFL
ncbi:sensor histidine kinase [Lyngbya confervoides]|uniref:histidine kinase n=1 Tax=Lyngbya confervoides BDU141951 TaxID=1574623 RepID=A0ABD4T5S1_9CYAN|nr:HAMP domain-containing sensor histidine kinase [Lyngbya confervoides]MCM1983900.1 HAMP domain-containing histidine kinase [Lyngbya confervoides BDU141951]